MADFQQTLLLNTLIAGRKPYWIEQTSNSAGSGNPDYTGAPAVARGCPMTLDDTLGAIRALLRVQLRENPTHRTCRIYSNNYVNAETYTVSPGGNAVAVVAAVSWANTIALLVAALPGVPAAAALVTFTQETTLTTGDTLVVRWKTEAPAAVDGKITAGATGAATIRVIADPESCDARIWFVDGGSASSTVTSNPTAWAQGDAIAGLTYRGLSTPVDVAGRSRAYCELYNVAGVAGDGGNVLYADPFLVTGGHTGLRVWWGPCINEG
jgi:hypothetical protein